MPEKTGLGKDPRKRSSLGGWVVNVQKWGVGVWNHASPFLAPKFWPVYIISFALGFYLWGPWHGWNQVKHWTVFPKGQAAKNQAAAVSALEQEVKELREELERQKEEDAWTNFNPEKFTRPVEGQIIKGYEWTMVDNSWKLHAGADIGLPVGSNVLAAAAGVVGDILEESPGRYKITLTHGNGWESFYGGLGVVQVTSGQKLMEGAILGTSGVCCDGMNPGVHFGVARNGQPLDPRTVVRGLE